MRVCTDNERTRNNKGRQKTFYLFVSCCKMEKRAPSVDHGILADCRVPIVHHRGLIRECEGQAAGCPEFERLKNNQLLGEKQRLHAT